MADLLPPVVCRIIGDNSDFKRALGDSESAATGSASRLGGALKAIAGVAAGAEVVNFFKGAYDEAEEARKATAQTNAALKSTGEVAGISAKGVSDLANALSVKVGIDDEAIQSTENLLLTFTDIRNEAGRGNDIFTQTTKATLDMSVALGQDTKSSAIQLGKALQDPINGITALRRVGVSFTDSQREQIKTLVESGQTLEAQKIILAEINKEFGGSAEAAASPMARLGVAWSNLKETVGTAAMPVLASAATWLSSAMPAAINGVSRAAGAVAPVFREVSGGVQAFVAAFRSGGNDITSSGFAGTLERVGLVARDVFKESSGGVRAFVTAFRAGGNDVTSSGFAGALERVGLMARKLWDQAQPVLTQLASTFRSAFDAVRAVVTQVVAVISDLWARFGERLLGHIQVALSAVLQIIRGALTILKGVFDVIAAVLTGDWSRLWLGIREIFGGAWNVIVGLLRSVLNLVSTIIGGAMAVISAIWGGAWHAVATFFSTIWDRITGLIGAGLGWLTGAISGAVGTVRGIWSGAWNAIRDVVAGVWGGIKSVVGGAVDWLADKISGVIGRISDGWSRIWGGMRDMLGGIWDGISGFVRRGINNLIDVLDTLIGGANTLLSHLPGKLSIPLIPKLATGGMVPGTGSGDIVPALLEPGEFVIRKSAVQAVGVDALHEINAQRYAGGGLVEWGKQAVSAAAGAVGDLVGDIARMGARALFAPIRAVAEAALSRLPFQDTMVGRIPPSIGRMGLDAVGNLIGAEDDRRAASGALGSAALGGGQWQAITAFLDSAGVGYTVTSTTGGQHAPGSYHYLGKAVDMVGNMGRIFDTLLGAAANLAELFYTPAGFSIKNGQRVGWTVPGHSDHVHAAVFDNGGTLAPGLNLTYNGTGRPEVLRPVGGGGSTVTINAPITVVAPTGTVPESTIRAIRDGLLELGRRLPGQVLVG